MKKMENYTKIKGEKIMKKITRITALLLCIALGLGMVCTTAAAGTDPAVAVGLFCVMGPDSWTEEFPEYFPYGSYGKTTENCPASESGTITIDLDKMVFTFGGAVKTTYRFYNEDAGFLFLCLLLVQLDEYKPHNAGVMLYGISEGRTVYITSDDLTDMADTVRELL